MRGDDQQQNHMFSYLSPEERDRKGHPLRTVRTMLDEVLKQLSQRFDTMYARVLRPSIAPERLLRAQLLQMLYSIRSESLLMEEMDYNLVLVDGQKRVRLRYWNFYDAHIPPGHHVCLATSIIWN
jgi:hypothetical protein